MKKVLSFGTLIAIFFVGCSLEIPKPQKKASVVKPKILKKKAPIAKKCDCPKPDIEEKKEIVPPKCPYETNVLHYVSDCGNSCGFPVSVRKVSTCKGGKK